MEPSFGRPDAYWAVPEAERAQRTLCGKSDCRIRDLADTHRRYFLRVMLPIPVYGEGRPCNWGIWVEVNASDFETAWARWEDPDQVNEPPFPGVLANSVGGYPETVGIPGRIQLTGPITPPEFTFDHDIEHPFAKEQRNGVFPERRLEWLVQRAHG